jgi:hypothetical protein
MVGSIYGYTNVYRFTLVDYNVAGWHTYEYKNWRSLDVLLNSFVSLLNYKGIWENSTTYVVNDLAGDETDSLLYKCLVGNTSPAAGSFSAYRATNPTHWSAVDQSAFDATSNRLMKKLQKMFQEVGAVNANARMAYLLALQSITSAAASASAAALSETRARATAQQSLIVYDQAKRAIKLINTFNPANIAFYSQVFGR